MLEPAKKPGPSHGDGQRAKEKPFSGVLVLEEKAFKNQLLGQRYFTQGAIGRGGMGWIFKAIDLQTDGEVAVKVCKDRPEGKEVGHVLSEAEALIGVSHPNVVEVKDYGMHGGVPFVVMELLSGKDLNRIVDDEGPLSWELIKDIAVQVCDGLGALHENGIIHADIKPSNIFITDDGVAKVLDFDISEFVFLHEDDGKKKITGTILGTPSYISPEQAKGRNDYDHRSDIYSLGLVMYKMLAGELPFIGSIVDMLAKQIREVPKRPSEMFPVMDAMEAAEDIIMKAIEKLPERRFQSMAEMRSAILNS